jgi:hypothetical protein
VVCQRSAFARRAAAAFALACAALSTHAPALAEGASASRGLEPTIARARGEKCVADPAFMRRNHMDLLKHQRNETVHRGVRDARASLKGCIGCHASAATGSVALAQTDFCVGCHSYAAVKVDCFECHASKPRPIAALTLPLPRSDGASPWRVALGRYREALSAGVR